ncbi:MAG: LemA family protein [Thalassobaculaceae bacterium]
MNIFLVLVLLAIAVLYLWYASLVRRRNQVFAALSGIDVQLQKRGRLIPNILAIAKRFMSHEAELLQAVTRLRSQMTDSYDSTEPEQVRDHLTASAALAQQVGRLMVTLEDYPALKSDQTMLQAQQTYNEVEAQIAAARRFYNAAVADLNNAIQIFPGSWLAGFAKAKPMPFFEGDEVAMKPVNAARSLE